MQYTFFLKPTNIGILTLKLPNLITDNTDIKRQNSMNVIGVLQGEHMFWRSHTKTFKSEISILLSIVLT